MFKLFLAPFIILLSATLANAHKENALEELKDQVNKVVSSNPTVTRITAFKNIQLLIGAAYSNGAGRKDYTFGRDATWGDMDTILRAIITTVAHNPTAGALDFKQFYNQTTDRRTKDHISVSQYFADFFSHVYTTYSAPDGKLKSLDVIVDEAFRQTGNNIFRMTQVADRVKLSALTRRHFDFIKYESDRAVRQKAEAERRRLAARQHNRAEWDRRAAEAARQKAERERLAAEAETERHRLAEIARQKAERERLAAEAERRRLAEIARQKAERERLAAVAETERQRLRLAEAARLKAERERLAAVAETERQRLAEIARQKAERERQAAAETERRRLAEIARQKAEQERLAAAEAERQRLRLAEAAHQKAEQERKLITLARLRARKTRLEKAARLKAEQERKLRELATLRAHKARLEAARLKAEQEILAREETERRRLAEEEARRRAAVPKPAPSTPAPQSDDDSYRSPAPGGKPGPRMAVAAAGILWDAELPKMIGADKKAFVVAEEDGEPYAGADGRGKYVDQLSPDKMRNNILLLSGRMGRAGKIRGKNIWVYGFKTHNRIIIRGIDPAKATGLYEAGTMPTIQAISVQDMAAPPADLFSLAADEYAFALSLGTGANLRHISIVNTPTSAAWLNAAHPSTLAGDKAKFFTQMRSLKLSNARSAATTPDAFAAAVQTLLDGNTELEVLDLSNNGITKIVAEAAAAPTAKAYGTMQKLRVADFSGNNLSREALGAFLTFIAKSGNKVLTQLRVTGNPAITPAIAAELQTYAQAHINAGFTVIR